MFDTESIRLTQFAKRAGLCGQAASGLPALASGRVAADRGPQRARRPCDGRRRGGLPAQRRPGPDLDDRFLHADRRPALRLRRGGGGQRLERRLRHGRRAPLAALEPGRLSRAVPLPPEVLAEILRGATDKASEAGIAIVGGHTIQTEEPIFGLAVVGRVHPRTVITNAGAQPGDFLILTKPLGLGIITTAAKQERGSRRCDRGGDRRHDHAQPRRGRRLRPGRRPRADRHHRLRPSRPSPQPGRRPAAFRPWSGTTSCRSCRRPANTSGRGSHPAAPTPTGGSSPTGSTTIPDITDQDQLLLCDAQTSGGLLAALPGDIALSVVHELHDAGAIWAALIGSIEPGEPGRIVVRCAPQFG